ncbi:uroporphyrinogen-III synthase [Sedimentitalea sp. XS_ASV28]|uniref:uroporphyrinogen-III synthase n=1 Tax=Sedimentitalea sp. XS_ASV28 TaxID=3241296 RepID=UPI003511F74F
MDEPTVTLLMTRPRPEAERFLRQLPHDVLRRVTPVVAPLLDIETCDAAVALDGFTGVIFSSGNAVRAVSCDTQQVPAHCVGAATARLARQRGWHTGEIGIDADALVSALIRAKATGPLLHLCGSHTRGGIAERLSAAGCATKRQKVYAQKLRHFDEKTRAILRDGACVIAPIFSPRTARQFVDQCPKTRDLHLVAMSAAVAEPLSDMAHSTLTVASQPNNASMALVVEKLVHRHCRVESGGGAQ